ncbi:MAG TPA: hypothetical protein VMT20_15370 [Terriglobia bacterium]|nr:hypothetical protein [Terriglobia bacterium]
MLPQFTITLQRCGTQWLRFTSDSTPVALAGAWRDGVPYQPDPESVKRQLPKRYHKSFEAGVWWTNNNGALYRHLRGAKGQPLGTLFAELLEDK